MSDEDLSRRAIAAYLRTERDGIFIVDEPGGSSGVIEHQGKTYVVLSNFRGTLAVYRVRTSGQLKRLRRWPAEVAEK
jgi:hypothetical protein